MSWLADAEKHIKSKNVESESVSLDFDRDLLIKELKSLYDNATLREIEKAILLAEDNIDMFPSKKELMNFLRSKLED